ncbi:hypothetical protein BC829DRAFT_439629 [Chytridium lagenaria]|nr:hypothetical protein BC829DRAFT_439629 [Chytridium lagenaria]
MQTIPGIDPNENFAGQLRMLHGMGFQDVDKSRLALKRSNGRIQEAIDMLVNDNIPPEDPDDLSSLALTSRTREGLRQLKSMGFTNVEANLQALRMARDDVDQAYILLVEQENGPIAVAAKPVSVPKSDLTGGVTLADVLGNAPVWGSAKNTSSNLGVEERSYQSSRSLSPNLNPHSLVPCPPSYRPSLSTSPSNPAPRASTSSQSTNYNLLSDIDFSAKPITVPIPQPSVPNAADLQRGGLLPDFSADNYLYHADNGSTRTAMAAAPPASSSLLTAKLNPGGASTLEAAFASFTPRAGDGWEKSAAKQAVEEFDPFGDEFAVNDPFGAK